MPRKVSSLILIRILSQLGLVKGKGDSPEAVEYTDLISALCSFAEFYRIEDLANWSIDALRSHEYKCGGSLMGLHFQDVYGKTKEGSTLRHHCVVATACFLSKVEGIAEHKLAYKLLSRLFETIPQFWHDVGVAQSTY
jgi:hypothetical protein